MSSREVWPAIRLCHAHLYFARRRARSKTGEQTHIATSTFAISWSTATPPPTSALTLSRTCCEPNLGPMWEHHLNLARGKALRQATHGLPCIQRHKGSKDEVTAASCLQHVSVTLPKGFGSLDLPKLVLPVVSWPGSETMWLSTVAVSRKLTLTDKALRRKRRSHCIGKCDTQEPGSRRCTWCSQLEQDPPRGEFGDI